MKTKSGRLDFVFVLEDSWPLIQEGLMHLWRQELTRLVVESFRVSSAEGATPLS